jgi:[acyl-carrier-protein] S-malonyltransferase
MSNASYGSYGILFAGQGNQSAAMLRWSAAAVAQSEAGQELARQLGPDWAALASQPAQLRRNRIAQPLITASSLACWEQLSPLLPAAPAVLAGYSVGELAAMACAGVLSPARAVGLAVTRATCMDQASGPQAAGMMSVSGLPVATLPERFPALRCAIRMAPDHAIFGGPEADLESARLQLSAQGVRCKRLDIEVASHTDLMVAAAARFATELEPVPFSAASVPLVTNIDGRLCWRADALKTALSGQICRMVDWALCMESLAEMGLRCVLEIGPGSALSALWNQRYPDIPARAAEQFDSAAGAARWIGRQLD